MILKMNGIPIDQLRETCKELTSSPTITDLCKTMSPDDLSYYMDLKLSTYQSAAEFQQHLDSIGIVKFGHFVYNQDALSPLGHMVANQDFLSPLTHLLTKLLLG